VLFTEKIFRRKLAKPFQRQIKNFRGIILHYQDALSMRNANACGAARKNFFVKNFSDVQDFFHIGRNF